MSWFRRNLVALVAVAVLLPATLAVTFWNDWVGYWDQRASVPTVVELGAEAQYGGAAWEVTDVRTAEPSSEFGRSIGLPADTRFVSVLLEVTPEQSSPGCQFTLREESGRQRTWNTADLSPLDYYPQGDDSAFCDSERTDPYRIEVYFVVPVDVSEELVLTIEVGESLPSYLRMRL